MDKKKIIDFFDNCSQTWDDELSPDDSKMDEINDAAGIKENVSVLDIACGTGVMFDFYLKRNVKKIVGIDISPKMVEKAKMKFSNNNKINVLCADADNTEFDEQFDCCMIFNAFPHFTDPCKLFNNLKKAIKSGGTLTIAHDWGQKKLDAHHKKTASEVSRGLMDEDELASLIESCGFSVKTKKATEEIYIVSAVKN